MGLVLAAVGCTNHAPGTAPPEPASQLPAAGASGAPSAAPAAAGAAGHAMAPAGGVAAPPIAGMPILPSAGISGMLDAGPASTGSPPLKDAAQVVPPDDDDAGSPASAALSCKDGEWALAPGFLLSKRVDYVEDRQDQLSPKKLSSAGTPCATAKDQARCLDDLNNTTTQFGRHLVTTAGDKVEFWTGGAAFKLLGLIDTPAEALWTLLMNGFQAPCEITVKQVEEGYRIEGVPKPDYGCAMQPGQIADAGPQVGSVFVRNDTLVQPEWLNDGVCGTPLP